MKDISGWISKFLSLDPECGVGRIWFDHEFLYVLDAGISRSRHKVVAKAIDASLRSLNEGFDLSVFQIANVTFDLMLRGGALGEITISHTLDQSADQESSCDHQFSRVRPGIPSKASVDRCRWASREV